MIINSNTLLGSLISIKDANGVTLALPIKAYNTETEEVTFYLKDEMGQYLLQDEALEDGTLVKVFVTKTERYPNSYASIQGHKVVFIKE